MKTSRITLSVCAAAALALGSSSSFAQQVDVSKHRQNSVLSLHSSSYSNHVSGDLYSSTIAKYLRDPSSVDLLAARWGGAGFAAPRSHATARIAAAHLIGGANTIETPSTFQGSFGSQNAFTSDIFGSFAFQPATTFSTFTASANLTAVPEPSTWFGAALLLGLIAWSQRRRFLALLRA